MQQGQVRRSRTPRFGVAAVGVLALVGAMAAQAAPAGASVAAAKSPRAVADGAAAVVRGTVKLVGTTSTASLHAPGAALVKRVHQLPLLYPRTGQARPGVAPIVRSTPRQTGAATMKESQRVLQNFDGVDAIQNKATAGFNLEPPDEGLGAGNGYVANYVNVTGAIYRSDGHMVAGPFYLNTFFGEPADANTSDPRVFYDPGSHRWFATILEYQLNSDSTRITESHVDVAVSTSADPTGSWKNYQIPTSDLNHSGCPCLADYPILGVDSRNVYISTNEFTSDESSFNGAQLYALSKSQLVAGRSSVNMVDFENLSAGGVVAFHVQPANEYGSASAEWAMNSLFPASRQDHRLGIWAVTHEGSVTSGHGMPALSVRIIHSESYSFPPTAKTPKGFCSGADCQGGAGAPTTGKVTNDWDAMQETEYINGQLVGALDTGVTIPGDTRVRSGVAWFVVHPSLTGSAVGKGTHVMRQSYVAVHGEYLLYPHINMTANGSMALTFGMGGPGTYLSAGYSVAQSGNKFRLVRVAAAGTGPDNGFTGTQQYGGVGRWGDYSNGEILPGTNDVWLATQYIPNSGTGNSNWGDRVFELRLP